MSENLMTAIPSLVIYAIIFGPMIIAAWWQWMFPLDNEEDEV